MARVARIRVPGPAGTRYALLDFRKLVPGDKILIPRISNWVSQTQEGCEYLIESVEGDRARFNTRNYVNNEEWPAAHPRTLVGAPIPVLDPLTQKHFTVAWSDFHKPGLGYTREEQWEKELPSCRAWLQRRLREWPRGFDLAVTESNLFRRMEFFWDTELEA